MIGNAYSFVERAIERRLFAVVKRAGLLGACSCVSVSRLYSAFSQPHVFTTFKQRTGAISIERVSSVRLRALSNSFQLL